MSFPKEIVESMLKFSALEERSHDIRRQQERIEGKLDSIIERLSRLEQNYEHLRASVRTEILSDIKVEFATIQMRLDGGKGGGTNLIK